MNSCDALFSRAGSRKIQQLWAQSFTSTGWRHDGRGDCSGLMDSVLGVYLNASGLYSNHRKEETKILVVLINP